MDTMKDTKFDFKGAVPSEAILTAVAAGTPPDGGSNFDYPNLFYKGAVIPVNDYVATSTRIKKDDVLEKLWESSFYGDKMIGVPGIEGYLWWGLNCNIDTATKDGLDPTTLPTTWEDVLAWHKKETKFDSAGNLQSFGLDPYDAMAGEQDFAVQSFGGFNWWDEVNRKINLNNDAMIAALDMCGQFIKVVGPDKFDGMRQTQGMGGWGGSYNAGMQNMIIEGYWHPGETEIQKPEVAQYNRATWAPVPASRAGKKIMATGAHFIQIFKDAAHKDGIFKFSELLWTDEFSDILFKEVGWIFGRKSYLAKVDPKAYPGLDFYMKAFNEVDEWIIGRRCPIHQFVLTQYTEIRAKVARDTMTPAEGAAELQKRAENEWAAEGLS
jgi:multiple sugar transport system substrate-binding protein